MANVLTRGGELSLLKAITYFSTGCLSIRSALWKTNQRKAALKDSKISNKSKSSWAKSLSSFQSRLAWHCHFIQKLEQEPTLDLIAMNVDLDSRMEREYDCLLYTSPSPRDR